MTPDRSVSTAVANRDSPLSSEGVAQGYAAEVLYELDVPTARLPPAQPERLGHPQFEWARCGAMALCGPPEGPPLLAPAPLACVAQGALVALRALSGSFWAGGALDAASLLGEHAAVFGHRRRGAVSPGGNCRMLEASDAWLAVNLARASDREMIPAWLELESRPESVDELWSQIASRIALQPAAALVSRARLMGLPVAPVAEVQEGARGLAGWLETTPGSIDAGQRTRAAPLVLDLSSLWAGPLCAHLLGLAGARVIKLESWERPDGARSGPGDFFDLLNANKASVAVEFSSRCGRRALERLLERADIVIESARPRALVQLGIVAEEWVARRSDLTWLSITGYGRREPEASWVAFGDDAAAAAGLPWATSRFNQRFYSRPLPPMFCGDAIADPLTGLHAAPAAWASWSRGGSRLLDISLSGVVRHILNRAIASEPTGTCSPNESLFVESDGAQNWRVRIDDEVERIAPPRARPVIARAAALGVDTDRVLRSLGIEVQAGSTESRT